MYTVPPGVLPGTAGNFKVPNDCLTGVLQLQIRICLCGLSHPFLLPNPFTAKEVLSKVASIEAILRSLSYFLPFNQRGDSS